MIIFDLDQTLVDTSSHAHLRRPGKWGQYMKHVPNLEPYTGVNDLLSELHARGESLAILTTSPDMVPRAFIRQYGWSIAEIVGFHDVSFRKPDPEGILKIVEACDADPSATFHIGDRAEDTEASRRAGVTALAAGWGTEDLDSLTQSRPDHLFLTVEDLRVFLLNELSA